MSKTVSKKKATKKPAAEKPATKRLFKLIEDNDGHWFVIPVDKEDQFWEWVRAQEDCKKWKGDASEFHEVGGHASCIYFTDWQSKWDLG